MAFFLATLLLLYFRTAAAACTATALFLESLTYFAKCIRKSQDCDGGGSGNDHFFSIFTETVSNGSPPASPRNIVVDKRVETTTKRPIPTTTTTRE